MTRKYKTWTQDDYVLFVTRWQQADSVKELADIYGISVQTIYNRACNLRKKGVPLKKMKTSKPRLDYDALIELAANQMDYRR